MGAPVMELSEQITDRGILDALEKVDGLLHKRGVSGFELCEATRLLVWEILCASFNVPYSNLKERHSTIVNQKIDEAYRSVVGDKAEEYKGNIQNRKQELNIFFDTGRINLRTESEEHFVNQFGDSAKNILSELKSVC